MFMIWLKCSMTGIKKINSFPCVAVNEGTFKPFIDQASSKVTTVLVIGEMLCPSGINKVLSVVR